MERSELEALFERLFENVQGYLLSHRDRARLGISDRSFVYGEVLPGPFLELLERAAPRPGEVFYDLGSGVGRAVVLAALAFPFARAVGVERLGGLCSAATRVSERLGAELGERCPAISFLEADLLEVDLSEANVVFLHANCFQPPLLEALPARFEALPDGARVISVGHLLGGGLELIETTKLELGWGESQAAIYRRAVGRSLRARPIAR